MTSCAIIHRDCRVVSESHLYAVVDLHNRYMSRGLEYDEAAVELLTAGDCEYAIRPDGDRFRLYWGPQGELQPTVIGGEGEDEILARVIRFGGTFGGYRVVEEILTSASWWRFAQPGGLPAIYGWGNEDQAFVLRGYLDSQRDDGDQVAFQMRELSIRAAFALQPADDKSEEHWFDIDDAIRSTRTVRTAERAEAMQTIAQCTVERGDALAKLLGEQIAGAIRFDRLLAALDERESNIREELGIILARAGWALDGDMPVRLKTASA
jgi:hypothetical protein